jgi:hypothetical protein
VCGTGAFANQCIGPLGNYPSYQVYCGGTLLPPDPTVTSSISLTGSPTGGTMILTYADSKCTQTQTGTWSIMQPNAVTYALNSQACMPDPCNLGQPPGSTCMSYTGTGTPNSGTFTVASSGDVTLTIPYIAASGCTQALEFVLHRQ